MMEKVESEEILPGPLEGIRIVECAVWHAGPGSSAILSDMGAEVIKVETLAGDPERTQKNLGAVNFEQPIIYCRISEQALDHYTAYIPYHM